ncbi:MAG: cytochrome b [Legionellales bacterium]|nr:cytochrome b [Legionellales bacterium]|tara:strand:+ start:115 stop:1347 length:1233 start_codon:yes stop_codon:yes gene_type:complete
MSQRRAETSGISDWINQRLPVNQFFIRHLVNYFAPKNLNFWYFFGVFSLVVLANQVLTGIALAMVYTPTGAEAFASVEHIMRHVPYGWLLRYMHSTGASAFFIVIYLHIYRALMYGSYRMPRELLWLTGCVLFMVLMAESFTGYVLPWGQMSFWGAKVIAELFGTIPGIGTTLVHWIQGDYVISEVLLKRFFAFHVIAVPLILIAMVMLHIVALHSVGSNNPEGIEIKDQCDRRGRPLDGIQFHPYYTVKDIMAVLGFLIVFAWVLFYVPEFWGLFLEPANFQPANPLVTPAHIQPVWYFSSFFAMLRAVPDKSYGALVMLSAVVILCFVPWLDRSPVRSIRYKGIGSKIALSCLVLSFSILGFLGTQPAVGGYLIMARIMTGVYFACFLAMPIYTRIESCRTPPKRIQG